MPTMRHSNSVANLHDKQHELHQHSASTKTKMKMKMSKSAPDLLKRAVTSIKSKTDALRTKLIILASMRRRLAMVAAMSRKVHTTLVPSSSQEKIAAAAGHHRRDRAALVLSKAVVTPPSKEPTAGKMAGLSLFEIAVFDEDDGRHGYHDWTRSSLFDDDNFHCNDDDEEDGGGDVDVLGALDDGEPSPPSVIEVIRSNREAEGLKFNLDDEIDEACDMFIRRCRSRMDLSL